MARAAGWGAGVVVSLGLWAGSSVAGPVPTADALALARSPYFKVRVAAAQVLATRGDDASRAGLAALLADEHPLVRLAAAQALANP
jgi:HEAT repeat protein